MNDFNNLAKNYQRFLKNLKKFSEKDQRLIKKAYQLARQSHGQQRRDEGSLYIIHPLRAANLLMADLKITDPAVIVAALLHDVVEDTAVSLDQIKKDFNRQIFQLVKALTRFRPKNETTAQKIKSKKAGFKKLMNSSAEIRLIKSVDLLDNIRSWRFIPPGHPSAKKFSRWQEEYQKFYLPLAKTADEHVYQEMKKAFRLFLKT